MKILVTGGAGFLGSNLCEKLLSLGHEVSCLDNFYTGKLENINKLKKSDKFKLIVSDICNPLKIDDNIEQIYNLACPASPPAYQGKHSIETTKTCIIGTLNMLELAKEHNASFLQSSTSEIYGDPLKHPQSEEYWGNVNPNGVRSCYDEGKRCAESLCLDFKRYKGVDVKIVRIFNTYGKNMASDDGRVVSNFIWQALNGKDLSIYGDGSQTRSFCYVDDLIDGLIKMMNSKESGPINLGNPQEFTVKELAEKVIDKVNKNLSIIYRDLPKDDPRKRKPDITKAITKLNWKPYIQLDEGLDKTINYFKELMND